jgi:RNA polymerase sigma-70 factor (ECF subfamily)
MRNRATASAHETVRPNRAVLELLVNGRTKYIKFLLSRLRDRDVAEEIFQQLIIKILERKSQLRSEARAEAWIYRVLRNAVIDHHRRSSRGVLAMQEGSGELEIAAPEPTPALCPCAPAQLVKLKAQYQDALRDVTMAGNSVRPMLLGETSAATLRMYACIVPAIRYVSVSLRYADPVRDPVASTAPAEIFSLPRIRL